MGCDLTGGARITFLNSGVIVEVSDLSTESSLSRLSHARVTVTGEAGKVIRRNATNHEPVLVVIGGVPQHRYLYNDETLKIKSQEATFQLYDAQKILDRGVLSENFEEVNVGEITDYIFENRDDPENVLTDIQVVDNDILELELQTTREDVVETLRGADADAADSGWRGAINKALEFSRNFVGFVGRGQGMPQNTYKGIEFEDTSPYNALRMVEQDFGLSSWVDVDGTLVLGIVGSKPNQRHAVSGISYDKNYAMSEYTVVEGAFNISVVKVQGQTKWYSSGRNPSDELYPISEVWVEDEETGLVSPGKVVAPDEPKPIWDLVSLEQAAKNIIINAAMNYRNGTIVFNGMASAKQEELVQMSVGDIIMVSDYVEGHCANDATGGSFIVTSVNQKVSPTRGWKTTCGVGQIPTNLQTSTFYYNASDDDTYDNMKAYKSGEEN